jgi:hypothetical protein
MFNIGGHSRLVGGERHHVQRDRKHQQNPQHVKPAIQLLWLLAGLRRTTVTGSPQFHRQFRGG